MSTPRNNPIRAAQYLRMSSENQRYSTENQQNAIAEYAKEHGYEIVASYIDAGKSGLSLKGRDALKQLLSDALTLPRIFDAILVLDVSRWGRFQDPDQAGHYEFLCREAGVLVVYCAEPFGDDVAPITTIVKHLKRVMAGEYSRELSAKLSRARRQQAQLGFRQGGSLSYGFRRLLVDPARNPVRVLKRGEKKAVNTERVIVVPGPPEELAAIRRIFKLYVGDQLNPTEIARRLAAAGVRDQGGKPLRRGTIRHILSNELCIGQMTYNVTTRTLQGPTLKNPEESWTRVVAFRPIVPIVQFRKAQERLSESCNWNKDRIAKSLQKLLAEKGCLSQRVIAKAEDAPCYETVVKHFGSLHAAYEAVGYDPANIVAVGNNAKHWSKKCILRGLQKLYRAEGRISTRLVDAFPELPSTICIRRRFGTVPNALREAGLPVLSHTEIRLATWGRRRAAGSARTYKGVRWTDAELLRALRDLDKRYGYISANLLDQNGDTPTAYYYARRFGSLTRARVLARLLVPTRSQLTAAGMMRKKEGTLIRRKPPGTPRLPFLHYRSSDVLVGLRRLAEKNGLVSARLIDEDRSLPSWGAVRHHFGSLCAAYKLAGLVRLPGRPVRFGLPPQE